QCRFQLGYMPVIGTGNAHIRRKSQKALLQILKSESGKSGSTAEKEDVGHGYFRKEQENLRGNKAKATL
ncbi:MAG: hypothetical protein JZU55_07010, partial [Afipia sp.]|nr:hypothetical protein [Afipia sp.]